MIFGRTLRNAGLALLGLGLSLQILAQNAALPVAPAPAAAIAASDSLNRPPPPPPGRLFFSAERRQALDQQRRTKQFQETVVEGDTLTLNGMVTRSSGKWTLWINGSPVTEKDSTSVGAAPVPGRLGQGRLKAGGDSAGSSVLVVGDGIDRSTGSSASLLGDGAIRVHSRAAGR